LGTRDWGLGNGDWGLGIENIFPITHNRSLDLKFWIKNKGFENENEIKL
jgi:hypothetical protein